MKYIKVIILLIVFSASFSLSSCNSSKSKTDKMEESGVKGKEYTSKYICPMYCKGSGSSEMGTCPVCKMDYDVNEDFIETKEN